jgi:hypothetical protein
MRLNKHCERSTRGDAPCKNFAGEHISCYNSVSCLTQLWLWFERTAVDTNGQRYD